MAKVVLTDHARYRLLERNIDTHEVIKIANNGKIIKSEQNGTITKIGISGNGRTLVVILISKGNKIIIKTAYYGN